MASSNVIIPHEVNQIEIRVNDQVGAERKCSYAPGNNFMRVWTNLWNRKCSYIAGNDFM